MFKTRQKILSQNFLWNRELVNKLVRKASITTDDFVVEIGPGTGIITECLLGACKHVLAVEADEKLFHLLKHKFEGFSNLTLLSGDFLELLLPVERFKIFSNIPFSITGMLVKKLLFSENTPTDGYLILQNEAADKFIAEARRNTMLSMLFYPWFDIKVIHRFHRTDFKPIPGVDSCMIHVKERPEPLLDKLRQCSYRDFIVFYFTRDRQSTSTPPNEWLRRFNTVTKPNDSLLENNIKGSFDKWRKEERNLEKIHRTRKDKSWKRF